MRATQPRSGGQGQEVVAEPHVSHSHLNVKVFHSSFLGSEQTCRNKTVKINSGSNQETQQQQREHRMLLLPSSAKHSLLCDGAAHPGVDHELIANDGVIKERFADL